MVNIMAGKISSLQVLVTQTAGAWRSWIEHLSGKLCDNLSATFAAADSIQLVKDSKGGALIPKDSSKERIAARGKHGKQSFKPSPKEHRGDLVASRFRRRFYCKRCGWRTVIAPGSSCSRCNSPLVI